MMFNDQMPISSNGIIYQFKGNELISVGLLIGMAASKKGSMDLIATKKVSTQLAALLPSSATELPISHTTQIAGLVSLGLLYQGRDLFKCLTYSYNTLA